jgi:hypothetical protein
MALSWKKLARKYERKLDLDSLNSVQNLVIPAVEKRKRNIQIHYGDLTVDQFESEHDFEMYKESIADDYAEADGVAQTLSEMLVTALYKLIEIKRKHLFVKYVENVNENKLGNIEYVEKKCTFDITTLKAYSKIDELRLINNCIKHNDSKVSDKLVEKFPSYVVGQELAFSAATLEEFKESSSNYVDELASKFHSIEDGSA